MVLLVLAVLPDAMTFQYSSSFWIASWSINVRANSEAGTHFFVSRNLINTFTEVSRIKWLISSSLNAFYCCVSLSFCCTELLRSKQAEISACKAVNMRQENANLPMNVGHWQYWMRNIARWCLYVSTAVLLHHIFLNKKFRSINRMCKHMHMYSHGSVQAVLFSVHCCCHLPHFIPSLAFIPKIKMQSNQPKTLNFFYI